jgi:hypothetical protein
MFYTPWFEARPGANRETVANHAAVGLVAQGLDALLTAGGCRRKTFSQREKTPHATSPTDARRFLCWETKEADGGAGVRRLISPSRLSVMVRSQVSRPRPTYPSERRWQGLADHLVTSVCEVA